MSDTRSSTPAPRHTLPLPAGTYTLLPLVQACDNLQLPSGPWEAKDCKERWSKHRSSTAERPGASSNVVNHSSSSALDDDDDDEEEDPTSPAAIEKEFLAPFFLTLPKEVNLTRRRSSSCARSSPFRLTRLPSLRSSSPTPSSSQAAPASSSSTTESSVPIGFIRGCVIRALVKDNEKMVSMHCRPVWAFLPPIALPPPPTPISRRSSFGSRRNSHSITPLTTPGTPTTGDTDKLAFKDVVDGLKTIAQDLESGAGGTFAVGFEDWVGQEGNGEEVRKEHMDRISRGWKMAGEFADVLGGWRDEEYAIYGPADRGEGASPLPGSNVAFTMERSACSLFGLTTFGVHCTAYVEEEEEPLKLWVPRRSATKPTWPSYLDNTVAGGITAGDLPLESVIRECAEEASLSPSFVESAIRCTSLISYTYRTSGGWIQPEVQYIYDLKLPSDGSVVPGTNAADGEVESFMLMELEEVVKRMVEGEFKPNCAMVIVDFLLRHGYLTPESDARFLEVVTGLRRPLFLPGPA